MKLNQYEWDPDKDLIAEGAFAEVFRARDTNAGQRLVALKIYKEAVAKGTGGSAQRKYTLEKEFGQMDGLSHTNIISYFGLDYIKHTDAMGRASSYPVIIMELAAEGTLTDFLKSKPPKAEVEKVIQDIIKGVDYLHSEGILHRDLKPGNILITRNRMGQPVAKITDFGISRDLLSDQTLEQSLTAGVGTPHYMAPEQFFKKKYGLNQEISKRTDYWAVGVVVFRLLTGRLPFGHGEKDYELIRESILSQSPDLRGLPIDYKAFVSGCLQKHATNRGAALDTTVRQENERVVKAPTVNKTKVANSQKTKSRPALSPKEHSSGLEKTQESGPARKEEAVEVEDGKTKPAKNVLTRTLLLLFALANIIFGIAMLAHGEGFALMAFIYFIGSTVLFVHYASLQPINLALRIASMSLITFYAVVTSITVVPVLGAILMYWDFFQTKKEEWARFKKETSVAFKAGLTFWVVLYGVSWFLLTLVNVVEGGIPDGRSRILGFQSVLDILAWETRADFTLAPNVVLFAALLVILLRCNTQLTFRSMQLTTLVTVVLMASWWLFLDNGKSMLYTWITEKRTVHITNLGWGYYVWFISIFGVLSFALYDIARQVKRTSSFWAFWSMTTSITIVLFLAMYAYG